MAKCDPSYISMAKEIDGLTTLGIASYANPTFGTEVQKVSDDLNAIKTCEDFGAVYLETMSLAKKYDFDLEAYFSTPNEKAELNELVLNIKSAFGK